MTGDPTAPASFGQADAGSVSAAALSLARRFSAGATMWCVSPRWPWHGRHVAVEFVHPVIVGKRALPAVHVEASDLVGTVRGLARAGDVLLAVAQGDDAEVLRLFRSAEAWGLTRLWLGAGAPPPPGSAEHVIWLEGTPADLAPLSGDSVLLYHLLWELTHVVFEHPGLLSSGPDCDEDVCITCSDLAVVAEVRAVRSPGSVDVVAAGRPETVDGSLLDPLRVGDLVLVHAGVAVSLVGEDRQ